MLYGKGYMVNANWKDNKKLYNVWAGILRRCFDKNHNRYRDNINVCERWLCFDNFIEDVKTLEGWNEELFFKSEIQLDKDSKQFNYDEKIYSPQTCVWLTKDRNNELQSNHCYQFKAISPSGEEFIYTSQQKYARENGLDVSSINKCLKGKRKSSKGWTFQTI